MRPNNPLTSSITYRYIPGARLPLPQEDLSMSPQPIVSVIIPTRDRPHFVAEAVASIARQTLAEVELIIVDDHSVEPVVPSQLPRSARIARHLRPLGPGAARNTGLEIGRAHV